MKKKLQNNTPSDAADCSAWVDASNGLPEDGEWVLHTYYGVRPPEYGLFQYGKFWRSGGPESFPTSHWLRIPFIGEPNK